MTEADTCRKYVVPKLVAAGWEDEPHSIAEQRTFTDGRIIPHGNTAKRRPGKRADYILRYTRDVPLAIVEAKSIYETAGKAMQQAKDYAEILKLKFAYATNGTGILEFDFLTGKEQEIATFPTPDELWNRLRSGSKLQTGPAIAPLLAPANLTTGKEPRYYQQIAINGALDAILAGKRRVLLTMATGTGKTVVAFQICWKLWSSRWNRTGEHRKPRILYLADRNFLVDDPKDKTFAPFGDARWKIEGGQAVKSREMYFATYQSLAVAQASSPAGSGGVPPPESAFRFREFPRDFFDLIIVDECHRGSARDKSNWREILEYFEPAYQLGMTATPLRDENRDSYLYFGNPIYTYSLRQGIDDGFLAPYRVHRVVTQWDAAGWRPSKADLDRFGRPIPDDEYHTPDFERIVSLRARTEAIARHLTDFLKKTDRFAKTIVFCVDQEHADEMRRALNNLNRDLVGGVPSPGSTGDSPVPAGDPPGGIPSASPPAFGPFPNYVCRVTADEGDIGRGHMQTFQDVETATPAILTTSQLLSTGLDAPTCKNVVIARLVNSMVEFKQIIGRGTRVRDDYGKFWFNILDYTGSATQKFADPTFDGDPAFATQEEIDAQGNTKNAEIITPEPPESEQSGFTELDPPLILEGRATASPTSSTLGIINPEPSQRRKYYFDQGSVEIAAHLVYELDADGKQLRVLKYTDYTANKVRTLYASSADLRKEWSNPENRDDIIAKLAERGIDFDQLALQAGHPEADPLDLLCHLAFNAPLRTRRERADRLKREAKDFFDKFGPDARAVLNDLLDKYTEHGAAQFQFPDVLRIPPLLDRGTITEIADFFGGPNELRTAVNQLQTLLYAA